MILSTLTDSGNPYLIDLENIVLLEVTDRAEENFSVDYLLKGGETRRTLHGRQAEALFSRFVEYHAEKGELVE